MTSTTKRPLLSPPPSVRGMTQLDRSQFTVRVDLPLIYVPASRSVSDVATRLKRHDLLLKYKVRIGMKRRAVADSESHEAVENESPLVPMVLNPEKMEKNCLSSLPPEIVAFLDQAGVNQLRTETASIDYDMWSKEDIFRAVLPEGEPTVSGYSIVGHIVHLNLKESLYPFKTLIGEVLLDKVPQAKTVVNKVKNIESVYRNFEIELLAGEANYKTRVKENGCLFDLDYSQVYWNSRLCNEHKRVVDLIRKGDLVIDGFAGIGPFAVLAAKTFATAGCGDGSSEQRGKKRKLGSSQPLPPVVANTTEVVTSQEAPIRVIANDLNPQACDWLRHNLKLNRVPEAMARVFNMDAADFFQSVVKPELLTFLASATSQTTKAHIIMNLPATAVSFLPCFLGLLSDATDSYDSSCSSSNDDGCVGREIAVSGNHHHHHHHHSSRCCDSSTTPLPIVVYCYTFSRSDDPVQDGVRQACDALGLAYPPDPALISGHDVRNVAPSKQMICVQIQLTQRILFEVRQRPPSGSHRSSPD